MSRADTPLPGGTRDDPASSARLRFQRVAALFEALRPLDAGRREELLAERCEGDADLLVELRALLAHHDAGLDVLDGSVVRPGVGARIGRYRVDGILGEGGMGTVYAATQLEPVRREVALKVIKLGMDTRQVVRRFEAERQALARIDHPNVARVLDGGATPDGRPYFVMELVRGEIVTRYADERRLEWRERVRLMLDVCAAVHHAHQRGLIHRDLKPSNILVSEVDGEATPKIIDFGVAKALDAGDGPTQASMSTALGHVIGTPEYMSPEQAAGQEVDTRTDVYALGVVLYELLSGVTPVAARAHSSGRRAPTPHELRRRLLEDEPPRVSSAIDEERAERRRSNAPGLRRALRGDLDWIVLKALARDPVRRYGSVAALADDLERLLADEPIAARPPSAGYLLAKFARRHTVALLAAGGIAAALVIGTALSLVGLQVAQAERDAAREAEREQARMARALGRQLFASDVERGRKAAQQGNWSEAWQLLGSAIRAEPDSPQARWALRETVWEQGCLLARRFESRLRFVRFLPEGRRLFLAAVGHDPMVIDVDTGATRPLGDGPGVDAWEVAVSRDGRWGFTGDMFGTVIRWDLEGTTPSTALVTCGSVIGGCSVLADPDEDVLYAGGVDGVVWRIDYAADPPRAAPIAHGTRVKRLALAPDGTLAVGDDAGGVLLVGRDGFTRRIEPQGRAIQSMAFGEGGRVLATGSTAPTIVLSDVATGRVLRRIATRVGTARDIRFGPDDRTLLVLGWWALSEISLADESVATVLPCGAWRFDVARDGQTIALASAESGLLRVWNVGSDRGATRGILPPRCLAAVSGGTASPFVAVKEGSLAELDLRGRSERRWPVGSARTVVVDDRGPIAATVASDGRLRVRSLVDGRVLAQSRAADVRADASTIDFGGGRLAYCTGDGAIEIIDLEDGSVCRASPRAESEVLGVALSDDGRWLGSCLRGDRNRILDLASGDERIVETDSTCFTVAFTSDGARMVLGNWRGDVVVVDVATGERRFLLGHSARVRQVVAHPEDPELVLSASDDGSVRVWHLGLMHEVAILRPFREATSIRVAGFVDGGRGIGVAGIDGGLVTYSIPTADRVIGEMRAVPDETPGNDDP